MSSLFYDVANPNNWEFLYGGTFNAPELTINNSVTQKAYPIPTIYVPFSLDNFTDLVAIYCSSNSAKDSWHYAGKIFQITQTGITVGTDQDTVVKVKKLWLNQLTILQFHADYGSSFALKIEVPYWIRNISINLWKYIGDVQDSYEQKMNTIHSDLTTLIHDFDAYTGV